MLRVAAIAAADGTLTLTGVSPGSGPAEAGDPGLPFILETRDAAGRQVLAPRACVPRHSTTAAAHALGRDPGRRRRDGRRAPRGRRPRGTPHALREPAAGAPAQPARRSARRRRGHRDRPLAGERHRRRPARRHVQYSANRGRTWRTVHLGGSTGSLRLAAGSSPIATRAGPGARRRRLRRGRRHLPGVHRPCRPTTGTDPRAATRSARARRRTGDPACRSLHRRPPARRPRPALVRAAPGARHGPDTDAAAPRRRPTHDPARRHRGRPRTVRTVAISVAGSNLCSSCSPGQAAEPRARTAQLRVATTATATLSAGGLRFPVGPRARTLSIPIRPASRPLRLALQLRGAGGRTQTTLTIPRR